MIPERLGPYKIVDRIGAGGMGEVFKGVHEETGQVVAVKVLSISEGEDTQLLKRFRREIVSASRLSHDNIVRLFDSGEQDDKIWYAMEYIEGVSLSEMLSGTDPLPISQSLAIARDLCKAFVYMHSRGFTHRDIKPGNIMITREGTAKLVDFGLVKSKFATNITITGVVIGTPAYMSPEMLQGRDVDHRSDIFQLGQVLFKMLSGFSAFEGSNSFEIASNCVSGSPRSLVASNPKVSPALESTLLLCLEKKPEDRYQSAADFLNDLRRVEKGLKPVGTGGKKQPAPSEAAATQPTQPMQGLPKPVPGGSRLPALLAGALVVSLASWAIVAHRTGGYDFRNLKISAGLRSARISWDSERPYTTRASYARSDLPPAASAEPGSEVVNAEEGESIRHTLELKNLDPDASYRLSVVYPDRSQSLAQPFRTLNPGLGSYAFTFGRDGEPSLAFSTFVPAAVTLSWGRDRSAQAVLETLSTSHSAVLTGADLFGDGAVGLTCVDAQGEKWTPAPLALPDARASARDLVRLLEPVQSRVVNLIGSLDKAWRQRKPDPGLLKDPFPKNVMDALARFTPIGPVFFSSRKPSLDEKIALYRPLAYLDALDRFCELRKLPFQAKAGAILGPGFGPLKEPRLPEKGVRRWATPTKLVTAHLSPAQADLVKTFSPKSVRELPVKFNLSNVAALKRAELTVRASWGETFAFEEELAARINQNLELSLRRDPAVPLEEHNLTFVHGFDPRALTEGENELNFTLRPLPGLRSATELEILEVVLRVER